MFGKVSQAHSMNPALCRAPSGRRKQLETDTAQIFSGNLPVGESLPGGERAPYLPVGPVGDHKGTGGGVRRPALLPQRQGAGADGGGKPGKYRPGGGRHPGRGGDLLRGGTAAFLFEGVLPPEPEVAVIPVEDLPAARVCLVRKEGRKLSPCAGQFIRMVKEAGGDWGPGLSTPVL